MLESPVVNLFIGIIALAILLFWIVFLVQVFGAAKQVETYYRRMNQDYEDELLDEAT